MYFQSLGTVLRVRAPECTHGSNLTQFAFCMEYGYRDHLLLIAEQLLCFGGKQWLSGKTPNPYRLQALTAGNSFVGLLTTVHLDGNEEQGCSLCDKLYLRTNILFGHHKQTCWMSSPALALLSYIFCPRAESACILMTFRGFHNISDGLQKKSRLVCRRGTPSHITTYMCQGIEVLLVCFVLGFFLTPPFCFVQLSQTSFRC